MSITTNGRERNRARIDDKYKWNLCDIYPDVVSWHAEKQRVTGQLASLRVYSGKLAASPQSLADALDTMYEIEKQISRLYTYAGMLGDEDTRSPEPQGMRQEMQQLFADFSAEISYVEPELLRAGAAVIEQFLNREPRLGTYAFLLRDIVRRGAHTLSDAEEKILAEVQPLAGSAANIFGILTNADFPYPTITLKEGRSLRVDQAGYAQVRTSPVREDRESGMSAFFTALGGFSRTFGTTMNSSLQKALFYAKSRKYGSTLEASLNGPNIPTSVYSRLIEGINKNLPSLHRYLRLRKKMMNIEGPLHYYDLYAPLVASVDLKYSPDEAQKHVLASVRLLGAEYSAVVERSFNERWIDFLPSDGKRAGAYSNGGAYDVHPYMLLNYLEHYNDMSTLAHELGHTMHSYYSNTTQPYALAGYQIFVAEVASTFNEALLMAHMLGQIKDGPTRLSLLGNYLESIKSTVFRQTQFAEFELRMHEMAQRGEAITGDKLSRLYLDITKKYYGHDAGLVVVDNYVAHEWSYVPHFYRDFYVFQYATSLTAAEALAAKVGSGDADARDRYLKFLGSGGSKYPIELLKDAGVDMTTDEPLDLTMRKMNEVMDEMEALLSTPSQ